MPHIILAVLEILNGRSRSWSQTWDLISNSGPWSLDQDVKVPSILMLVTRLFVKSWWRDRVILTENVHVKLLLTKDRNTVLRRQRTSLIVAPIASGDCRLCVPYSQTIITLSGVINAETLAQTIMDLTINVDEDERRPPVLVITPSDVGSVGRCRVTWQFDFITFVRFQVPVSIWNNWLSSTHKKYKWSLIWQLLSRSNAKTVS